MISNPMQNDLQNLNGALKKVGCKFNIFGLNIHFFCNLEHIIFCSFVFIGYNTI